jgi:hypothetical protein
MVTMGSPSMRKLGWREVLLVALGVGCFVWAFSSPILLKLWGMGITDDWSEHLQPDWAAYYTIIHFHQIPLWNPYRCGGMPLLAHPLSLFVSPTFIVQLILGPFVGLNLQIPIHIAIAWTGGYALARIMGMGYLGRLICASVLPASSWFYLHMAVGHLEYLPTMYLPWIVTLVWLGTQRETMWPWIGAGLLLALTFLEGGVYHCTRVILLTGLLALYAAVVGKTLRPIRGMMVLGLFALGFAAIKLFPTWYVLQLHPRPIADLEYNPVRTLLIGIFTRDQFWDRFAAENYRIGPGMWGFFEVGTYISPAAVALAALGVVFSPRRALPWMLAIAMFFTLAMGGPRPWYPWALLHHFPIFSQERVPARVLMMITLPVGVIAGLGADFLAGHLWPLGAILAAALAIAAVVDARQVSKINLAVPITSEVPQVTAAPVFRQNFGSPWEMVAQSEANLGAVFCNEGLDFYYLSNRSVVGYNQPGYMGEQFLVRPGSVRLDQWTPNALSFEVDTPTDNVLVINQVYDANWRLVEGHGQVFSDNTMFAVRLPAGAQHLQLVFRSYPFILGAILTFLTSLAAIVLWRKRI